jgi:hypothetical protein
MSMLYHKKGVTERARVAAHVWWFLLESKTQYFTKQLDEVELNPRGSAK